jgi:predicted Zn finger-like uncharacterized protein
MDSFDAMDVRCPACAAQYVVDDEKLRGRTARMRCRACHAAWSVSARPSVAPPPSGFGARNENSVLFRIDQLKANTTPVPPAAKEATMSSAQSHAPFVPDDDGVIDLNALSSATPRSPAPPLFSEPVAMALDVATGRRPLSKGPSRMPLIGGIAAAAAIVALATGAFVFALRAEEPVKRTAAAPPPPPSPVVAALAPAIAPPPPVAAPAPAAEEEPAETKPTKKPSKSRASSKGGTAIRNTAAPASRPVKAADPCHCRGNFDCIIACAAKNGK